MSEVDEVYTDCPNCGVEIPFYHTVDGHGTPDGEPGACPECGTEKGELFDMAIGRRPIEPAPEPDVELALTDGGRDE